MTAFQRRQRILSLVQEYGEVEVVSLAKRLDVSEGTIRNDLKALDDAGQLRRVRGGAVRKASYRIRNPETQARAKVNQDAKQHIARWAADMVEDGDSILLDESTTAFHMVPFLANLRNLTIITNGIDTGLRLVKSTAHTVILAGGVLRPDGSAVTRFLGDAALEELNIKTAFVSCSGFSFQAGLTETDIQTMEFKSKLIQHAARVVALVDSSKFGKANLISYAQVSQIDHLLTDSDIAPRFIEQARSTNITFTVCGEKTVSSYAAGSATLYKVGFANLSEDVPFAVDVRRGLERAAKDMNLIVADNRLDGEVALQVADRLIAEDVDVAIEFQIDEKVGSVIMDKFRRANIPVIAIDIPLVGATFFGADNYRAGYIAGVALGEWVRDHWNGAIDRLLLMDEPRGGALPAARMLGQLDGLQAIIGDVPEAMRISIDSRNRSDLAKAAALKVLAKLSDAHRIAAISYNDDAALGALWAARELGREQDIVIVGQGADRSIHDEIRDPHSRIIGSTAYWPERYGEYLIDIVQTILNGGTVPPAVHVEHVFIDAANIDMFYPQ